MELTYEKNVDILDVKQIAASTIGYTLQPGINENSDINLILKSLFPHDVKVKITIVDIRLRSNLATNKLTKFSKKSFFFATLGFIQ